MPRTAVYSFKDVTFTLIAPILGAPFVSAGQVGLVELHVTYAADQSVLDIGADGTPMMSAIADDHGNCMVVVQQTSIINAVLLQLYNLLHTAKLFGDVSNYASTVIQIKSLTTGDQYQLNGVSFVKVPDEPYQKQGQNISWNLLVSDIQKTILAPPIAALLAVI